MLFFRIFQYPRVFGEVKCNVKYTLVQTLRLFTGCTAHRGSGGIALPFHDCGTRREWGVSVTPRPLFTPGKGPVPILQEAVWALGSVWTGTENLVPTGIRSPDRPACSQSLYRLRYPAHLFGERAEYFLSRGFYSIAQNSTSVTFIFCFMLLG